MSVVGLGKLGVCLAACAAAKGMNVVGVDVSAQTVALVNEGKAPLHEPKLAELIAANQPRLRATTDYVEAITQSDFTFVVVPTPSEPNGGFSLKYVAQATNEIGKALAAKSRYHVVVVTSTVLPGSTRFGILPLLEQASGKRCGRDFGLCYSPEFIALGSVIEGMLKPDFVLIGESDNIAGESLERWYESFCENHPPVRRMNFVNAELTKISVNTFVTAKITFANMLSQICEELPDADIDTVTGALAADSRIGKKYLTGAVGYGGPCFPRDNQALTYLAQSVGCLADLAEATDRMNRSFAARLADKINRTVASGSAVSILGLAYKPDTNVVEESPGIELARQLLRKGRRVSVFDPLAIEHARLVLGDAVHYAQSIAECLDVSDAVVVATPCPEFRKLRAEDFRSARRLTVFDGWRIFRHELANCPWVRYVPLGVGSRTSVDGQLTRHIYDGASVRQNSAR